jgi:methylase of polypeptide subunit release factors
MSSSSSPSKAFQQRVTARQQAYLARLAAQDQVVEASSLAGTLVIPPGVAHPKLDSHLLSIAGTVHARGHALDAFCGAGVVGLAICSNCEYCVFLDCSQVAIDACKLNCNRFGFSNVAFVNGTIGDLSASASFDLIVANPPYSDQSGLTHKLSSICFDPGHRAVRSFIPAASTRLQRNGALLVSWANFADFSVLEKILSDNRMSFAVIAQIADAAAGNYDMYESIVYRVYRCWNG